MLVDREMEEVGVDVYSSRRALSVILSFIDGPWLVLGCDWHFSFRSEPPLCYLFFNCALFLCTYLFVGVLLTSVLIGECSATILLASSDCSHFKFELV